MLEYVRAELERKQAMKVNWKSMAVRITGIKNPQVALERLVRNQSVKMLDLSKKIYKNSKPVTGDEYRNWYTKYFIPQSHCSKRISRREDKQLMTPVQDINIDGTLGDVQRSLEKVTKFINWQHPLMDAENVIEDEDLRGVTYDNIEVFRETMQNVARGNNPFFHIEHLLEVQGPMASIESMNLPANKLTRDVINIDPKSIQGARVTTRVIGLEPWGTLGTFVERRNERKLNIADARARFTSFKDVFGNLEAYGLIARPELAEGARGASEEEVVRLQSGEPDPGRYAESTELFHVDDFISAIEFTVQGDKSDKLVNHIRGLMHSVIPDDNRNYSIQDTHVSAAVGYPETIRRTPTRFIKKTRRFVKFNKDFVTHNFDNFVDGITVEDYKKAMFSKENLIQNNAAKRRISAAKYNQYRQHIEKPKQDEIEYYVVPSNGEDILEFIEAISDPEILDPEIKHFN